MIEPTTPDTAKKLVTFFAERLQEDELLAHIMIESGWPKSVSVVPHEGDHSDPKPCVSIAAIAMGRAGSRPRYVKVVWPVETTQHTNHVDDEAIEVWSAEEGRQRLRAVLAKRRLLMRFEEAVVHALGAGDDLSTHVGVQTLWHVLTTLACEWSAHRDFRPGWDLYGVPGSEK